MLDNDAGNHFTVCQQMSCSSFQNNVTYTLFAYKLYIYIYIYRERERERIPYT